MFVCYSFIFRSFEKKKKGKQQTKPPSVVSDDQVNQLLLSNLLDMGFSREQSLRALKATGGKSVDQAIDWCFSHPEEITTEKNPLQTTEQTHLQTTGQASLQTTGQTPLQTTGQIFDSNNQQITQQTNVSMVQPDQGQPTDVEMKTEQSNYPTIHDALCNNCMQQIVGTRYKCNSCSDFDLVG